MPHVAETDNSGSGDDDLSNENLKSAVSSMQVSNDGIGSSSGVEEDTDVDADEALASADPRGPHIAFYDARADTPSDFRSDTPCDSTREGGAQGAPLASADADEPAEPSSQEASSMTLEDAIEGG